ncbi:MAG: trypsin-like serine protease [Anaerolineae bacterium]|jgi:V8-like Glu-specific endopeptidase
MAKPSVSRRMWFVAALMFAVGVCAASAPGSQAAPRALPRDDRPPDPDSEVETIPIWTPPRNGGGTENQIVVYHADTGTTEQIPLPAAVDPPGGASMPGHFAPLETQRILPQDFNALSLVTNPSAWPWSVHVKLIRTFPTGIVSECSGVLVDSKHVLTAGHCVYTFVSERCNSPDTSCWASSIRVIPAYENGDAPFGETNFANLLAWTAWTVDQNFDWDIAMIELDRPVGAVTGWYGLGYQDDDTFFTGGNTFRSTGYPVESPYDGQLMYTWSGTFDRVETYGLIHTDYSYGGQSGSGVYRDDSNRIVYGALSHGHDAIPETVYTRITASSFTSFVDWITAHMPDTVDLVALDTNVSPTTFDRGDPLTALNYLIHNYSEAAWNGNVDVSVRLSTNDYISTSDTEIDARSWNGSLASRESIRINAGGGLPSIPGDICGTYPGGSDYWIGVILDTADANMGNNDTSGWDAAAIHVNACDAYENDDTWSQASSLYDGLAQTHDIIPATDVDWATFTLAERSLVILETEGLSGDTRMWLYDSGLWEIDYDDDDGAGYFSRMQTMLPPGTYYVKVDEYGNNDKIHDYELHFYALSEISFVPLVLSED